MTKEQLLKEIEEIITPHLFEWKDAYFMSDGKYEQKEYLTTFQCGYKFIKTNTNFQVLRTNVNMRVSGIKSDYFNITENESMLKDCLNRLKKFDWV